MRRPEIIAHRGAHQDAPENSTAAILAASELECDGIEIDVHATADGVVVVHHDFTVAVPGRSELRELADLTYGEVLAYPLADGGPIPTLSEVLLLLNGRTHLYIEVKAREIESRVLECIGDATAAASVHSYDHRVIRRLAGLAPALRRGILLESYLVDSVRALRDAAAFDLWEYHQQIDVELVRTVHDAGGRVVAWTVNTAADARRVAALGVDAICTDNVEEIREALAA